MLEKPLLIGLLFMVQNSFSQIPVVQHKWLTTENMSVRITPTGVHRDATGGFLFKDIHGNPRNLLDHLTPWVGGYDPAENLKFAGEMIIPTKSDWTFGYRHIPNSDKVWKVTKEQIDAHRADYQDDGIINNPISDVYSWPGFGNPFSLSYNGFSLDSPLVVTAKFYDREANGLYDPQNGDYPILQITGQDFQQLRPDQLVFSAFFNDTLGEFSHGRSIKMAAGLQAFTFDCAVNPLVKNVVFLAYEFLFLGFERLDSTYLGVYADVKIGNQTDDYLGCDLEDSKLVYGYNADTLSDAVAGANPSMIGIRMLQGPIDSNDIEMRAFKFMPIINNPQQPWLGTPVEAPEFYHLLSGLWKNGEGLTYGGTGYGGNTSAEFAYPGHPANGDEWSELSANNPLGNRAAVASFSPFTFLLNLQSKSMIIALTASNQLGVTNQLAELKSSQQLHEVLINQTDVGGNNLLQDYCVQASDVEEIHQTNGLQFFPNPTSKQLTLQSAEANLYSTSIFDLSGKKMISFESDTPKQAWVLDIQHLKPGMYILQWQLSNGHRSAKPLLIVP